VSRRDLARSEDVKRTPRGIAELLDHVRVDHRGLHVGVPEVLLNLPDVYSVEEQMRREAVTECGRGNGLVDLGFVVSGIDLREASGA
jgi:hypothetical protein